MYRVVMLLLFFSVFTQGCGFWRIDLWHYQIRSDVITSEQQEKEILSRAKVERTEDGRIRVLYLQGTAYERGYQHGALLRDEVQDNIGFLYKRALKKFRFKEFFDEAFVRMRPHISQEYIDEMHGLAHGARMPLHVIQAVHVLPSIGEWSGRRRIGKIVKSMMRGDFGTSCSNFSAVGSATSDENMYVVRILDWGLHRISKLHRYPLITVSKPEIGNISANIGWVGFIGEMGYGDPDYETLRGTPMVLMLRDVLTKADDLSDVRNIIENSAPTGSFVYLMSDGKTGESELYIRDPKRFLSARPGQEVFDRRQHKGRYKTELLPAISNVSYGGHYNEKMTDLLSAHHGDLSPELIMDTVILT